MSRLRDLLARVAVPVLAVVTAFGAGALVILLTDIDLLSQIGTDPIGALGAALDALVRGYGALFAGAIGDPGRILTALQSGAERDIGGAIRPVTEGLLGATPLILVSLGVGLALHAGLVNFGANGQFLIGSLGATMAAFACDGLLPPFVILIVAVASGTLFGAAYGFIPGALKARTGAHEVITTIMLNTIAAQIVIFVLRSGTFSGNLPSITTVPLILQLPTVRLDWSFVVALAMAAVVSFLVYRTRIGFELRATGFSLTAARSAGMRPQRVTIVAMSLSGALVGMGGALLTLGTAGGLTGFGGGYVALALAVIARLRPSGIALLAIVYGLLSNGAKSMVIETGIPFDLLVVVVTFVLLFIAAPSLVRWIWRIKPPDTAEEARPLPGAAPEPTGR